MEFEVLKKSHVKRNIVIGVLVIFIISAIILDFTRAKYRTSYSVPLINGIINYSAADLNIVAITVDGEEVDTIPTGNYELTEESYCEVNGVRETVTPLTTKGTKCYLYFDEYTPSYTMTEIIVGYNKGNRGSFDSAYTTATTNTDSQQQIGKEQVITLQERQQTTG